MHMTSAQHSVSPSFLSHVCCLSPMSCCGVGRVATSAQGRRWSSSNILCVRALPWLSPCRCLQVSLQGDFEAFLGACTFAGGLLILIHSLVGSAEWQARSGLAWQQTWHFDCMSSVHWPQLL